MPNQHEYYQDLAHADSGFGMLFLSVAMVTLSAGFLLQTHARQIIMPTPLLRITSMFENFLFGSKWLRWVMLIGFFVRTPGLFNSFWYDETFTGAISRVPLGNLRDVILSDVHPPLPYLMFWGTGRVFGTSEIALRSPNMLIGLFAIYLIYRYVHGLRLSDRTAQVSAWIMALLPAPILYSNEARGYMLLVVLVLVCLICANEKRPRFYALIAGLLVWTHAHGLIYLAVVSGVVLFRYRSKKWFKSVCVSAGVAGVWLPYMLIQSQDVANGFWLEPLNAGKVFRFLIDMTVGQRIEPNAILAVYVPVMSLTVISLWQCRKWLMSWRGFSLLSVAVGVPVITAIISVMWNPIYLHRALLPCAVLFIPLWAYTLTRAPNTVKLIYQTSFTPALIIALMFSFTADAQRFNVRSAFNYCNGSTVTFALSSAVGIMSLYYSDSPVILWSRANNLSQELTSDGKQAFGFAEGSLLEIMNNDVCLIAQDNPFTTAQERRYLKVILTLGDVWFQETIINSTYYRMTVYRIKLGGLS